MNNDEPYNPLAMVNLAHSIVTHMEEMEPHPLDTIPRFHGAGLYAIYYSGPYHAYELLAERSREGDFTEPIYVGKAVPPGGRRGLDDPAGKKTLALGARLREHARSIRATANLEIEDFHARWLVVEDIWIALGESAMLRRHRPVWNALVDGFGNHVPGKGRIDGKRSRWDTIHPGRSWAHKYPERDETLEAIEQDIQEYLRSRLA
ncbi:MAG: hypothetical protein QG622_1639 [Actinomycetota bacterium]|nr:hypothetical protein [Actinomycetota bacterium]